jgi:hypothetical protein
VAAYVIFAISGQWDQPTILRMFIAHIPGGFLLSMKEEKKRILKWLKLIGLWNVTLTNFVSNYFSQRAIVYVQRLS